MGEDEINRQSDRSTESAATGRTTRRKKRQTAETRYPGIAPEKLRFGAKGSVLVLTPGERF